MTSYITQARAQAQKTYTNYQPYIDAVAKGAAISLCQFIILNGALSLTQKHLNLTFKENTTKLPDILSQEFNLNFIIKLIFISSLILFLTLTPKYTPTNLKDYLLNPSNYPKKCAHSSGSCSHPVELKDRVSSVAKEVFLTMLQTFAISFAQIFHAHRNLKTSFALSTSGTFVSSIFTLTSILLNEFVFEKKEHNDSVVTDLFGKESKIKTNSEITKVADQISTITAAVLLTTAVFIQKKYAKA